MLSTNSRVLVETTPGRLDPGTIISVDLTDSQPYLIQLDGERGQHRWFAEQTIDPSSALEVCDECGQPEHAGECAPSWTDSSESLGLPERSVSL